MKVLVVGAGGREHALAWKLAQSPRVSAVYVAPGNAGTAADADLINVPIDDIDGMVAFAKRESVGLTVVGPEAPLAAGIVDAFRDAGLRIFGPSRAAAQLESSKDFAKAFMARHRIPTAAYRTFTDAGDAHAAIDAMLCAGTMGAAGARVVVEDFLEGEEASFIVLADGVHALALASSQDHKRLGDDDRGPNTGGMGAYSPAPIVTPTAHARIMREVIMPAIDGMATEGMPYTGFLYAGVMLDASGTPRVLEFNCRLGDPETQPIMMRLRSDLVVLLEHAVGGTLDRVEAEWDRRPALTVVLAAAGYPEAPRRGDVIAGLDRVTGRTHPDVTVFHAGTTREGGVVKVSGGRVLGVTALGDSLRQAQRAAYDAIAAIRFDGMQYRRDIGHRALARRGTKR